MTETRYLPIDTAEVRVAADSLSPRIVGYSIVFNSPSEVLSERGVRFREIVKPSAVAGILDGADIRALVDHESRLVLGRSTKGTLRYVVDERGVKVQIDPPNTTYANDLMESMSRGDVSGMSFRFGVSKGGDEWDMSGEVPIRTINQFSAISEFSVVTFPAYPDTEAAVRSLNEYRESQRKALTLDAAAERIRLAEEAFTAGPRKRRA